MGTIKKIGDNYFIEFVARGLKYQRNGGTDKKEALKQVENSIESATNKLLS